MKRGMLHYAYSRKLPVQVGSLSTGHSWTGVASSRFAMNTVGLQVGRAAGAQQHMAQQTVGVLQLC